MYRLLHVIAGPDQGHRFQIADTFSTMLGRSRHANTQLTDMSVSRVHCEIEIRNRRILLVDLDSGSGTFVNDKRVSECELRDGDVLRIGNTQMRVVNPEADKEATIVPPTFSIPARPVLMTSDRLPELTGTKLSHFEIGKPLAKGKSGLIFEGYDFKNDRPAAVKVLWPEFSQNEEDMLRFVRAMKTMMPLRHPNLVALYGAGKSGPYCWIAMELVQGDGLAQVLERMQTANVLDWQQVLRIGYYLAKALAYAHGKNIIHRNLTPQNVIVGKTPDQTKLGDLMLAKAQEGQLAQDITKPGEILGDLRYMAPERTASGVSGVDGRSDLYGLGALMYALLTGRPPIEGKGLVDTITKIRQMEPVRPKKLQAAIPDAVDAVVMKLLAKQPKDRYATAEALLSELERIAKLNKFNP